MLSSSTQYALKALLYLGRRRHGDIRGEHRSDYMLVHDLSQATNLPAPYLAKLIKNLGTRGIVETKKGTMGGVRPSKDAINLTFYDICVALDDPLITQNCFISKAKCSPVCPCEFHGDWRRIKDDILHFLRRSRIYQPDAPLAQL